jgi:hypothetical protein
MKKHKYTVIKIPLEYESVFKTPSFQPCDKLFMELLENKAKIKPEMKNVEFESKRTYTNTNRALSLPKETIIKAKEDTKRIIMDNDELLKKDNHSYIRKNVKTDDEIYKTENILEIKNDASFSKPDAAFLIKPDASFTKPDVSFTKPDASFTKPDASFTKPDASFTKPDASFTKPDASFLIKPDASFVKPDNVIENDQDVYKKRRDNIIEDDQEIYKKKKQMDPILNLMRGEFTILPDDIVTASVAASVASVASSSSSEVPVSDPMYQNKIPSLNKIIGEGIKPQNAVHQQPVNLGFSNQAELSKKRDIIFKLKRIKKEYGEASIPDVSEFTELSELERILDDNTRQLKIDSSVESYKKYLIIGFFGMEFLLTTFLKLGDIKGFAQQQMVGINQYEKILVEIGEKNSMSMESSLSPEFRLLGMVFMNTAVFLGTKMLFKATGSNIMNMMSGASSEPAKTEPPKQQKTKMKGPDFDFDDLEYIKKNN